MYPLFALQRQISMNLKNKYMVYMCTFIVLVISVPIKSILDKAQAPPGLTETSGSQLQLSWVRMKGDNTNQKCS